MLSELVPFIVLGIVSGSVYGMGGVGLVLTYKTSGILNLGYGAISTVAAYTLYELHAELGVNWALALLISVLGVGVVLGVVLERLAGRLAAVRPVYQVVACAGLLVGIPGLYSAIYGTQVRNFPNFLPTGTAFTVLGATVPWNEVATTGVAVALTLALFLLFRFTSLGIAMRGVVENPDLLSSSKTNPAYVRRISWIIGTTFACVAGVLLAPTLTLDPNVLTLLVIQCFAAAALGTFKSFPVTFGGGLVIGVGAAILTKYTLPSANVVVQGIPSSVPFIVLLVVLVVLPSRTLRSGLKTVASSARSSARFDQARVYWHAPAQYVVVSLAVSFAGLALVPLLVPDSDLVVWTTLLAYIVLFTGLGLLVRSSGRISLCHSAIMAIGSVAMAHFASSFGVPWGFALLFAGLISGAFGAVIALSMNRLSGTVLALATLAVAVVVQQVGYPLDIMFGTTQSSLSVPRPGFAASPAGFYYLALAITVLATVLVVVLTRSRLGRLLRASGDSSTALLASGATTTVTLLIVFSVSAFLAGISGAVYSSAATLIDSASLPSLLSLTFVCVLALSVGGAPWYAFLAAAALTLPTAYISGTNVQYWLDVIFGVFALAVGLTDGPLQVSVFRRAVSAIEGRLGSDGAPAGAAVGGSPSAERTAATFRSDEAQAPGAERHGGELRVEGLSVAYSGVLALNDFSFTVEPASVTGLIGPNGAGKSTALNACSGFVRPTAGRITMDGRVLDRLSIAERSRAGLGRSFQVADLYDSMTVEENVSLGREASFADRRAWRHMISRPRERREIRAAVADAIEVCGLKGLATTHVAALTTGQKRLVELARCLAGGYRVLLLDEPSSGLDSAETERVAAILRRISRERGLAVLLVEHDMELVRAVCDEVYVLNFGEFLAAGATEEVLSSATVRDSYLGADPGAEGRLAAGHRGADGVLTARIGEALEQWRDSGTSDARLACTGLTAGYRGSTVLSDVPMTVSAGSTVALLGPNGAGKTTFLRTVAGYLAPRAGVVALDGQDVTRLSPHERARRGVCYIPEGGGVFPTLSVRENILLAVRGKGGDEAIDRATEAFPVLGKKLRQAAGELSGGQQRMLAVVRSYVTSPSLILIDELSLGLAPIVIDQIYEFLTQRISGGVSMVIVEQYVPRALSIADSICVMAKGRMVFEGPEDELAADIFDYYTGKIGQPPVDQRRPESLSN